MGQMQVCATFLMLLLLVSTTTALVQPICDDTCACTSSKPGVKASFGTICKDALEAVHGVVYNPWEGILWGKERIKPFEYPGTIANVPDDMQSLYQGECGDHHIFVEYPNVEPGYYSVTIFMAEIDPPSVPERLFNVFVEGEQVALRLNVTMRAGGIYSGYNLTWTGYVEGTTLHVYFYTIVNEAKFSSILVEQLDCSPRTDPPATVPACSGDPAAPIHKVCPPGVPLDHPSCKPYIWGAFCRPRNTFYTNDDVTNAPRTDTPSRITIAGQTYQAMWATPYAASPAADAMVTLEEYSNDIAGSGDYLYMFQGECAAGGGNSLQLVFADVPIGQYKIKLFMAETYFTTLSDRIFNIFVNDQPYANNPFTASAFATAETVTIDATVAAAGAGITVRLDPLVGVTKGSPKITAAVVELVKCGVDVDPPPLCPALPRPCIDIDPYLTPPDIQRCSCGSPEILTGPGPCSKCIVPSQCALPDPATALGVAQYVLYAGQYNLIGSVVVWMPRDEPGVMYVSIKADTTARNAFLDLQKDIKLYVGTNRTDALGGDMCANYRVQSADCRHRIGCVTFRVTLPPNDPAPGSSLYLFVSAHAGIRTPDCTTVLIPNQAAALNALSPSSSPPSPSSGILCTSDDAHTFLHAKAQDPRWASVFTYTVPDPAVATPNSDGKCPVPLPCPAAAQQ